MPVQAPRPDLGLDDEHPRVAGGEVEELRFLFLRFIRARNLDRVRDHLGEPIALIVQVAPADGRAVMVHEFGHLLATLIDRAPRFLAFFPEADGGQVEQHALARGPSGYDVFVFD